VVIGFYTIVLGADFLAYADPMRRKPSGR